MQADVIGAAFHADGFEAARQNLLKKGNVFFVELFLKRFGRGRDNDALARGERWDQVGERLAGTGAGFDERHPAAGQRRMDHLGHLDLAGPVLVLRVVAGD